MSSSPHFPLHPKLSPWLNSCLVHLSKLRFGSLAEVMKILIMHIFPSHSHTFPTLTHLFSGVFLQGKFLWIPSVWFFFFSDFFWVIEKIFLNFIAWWSTHTLRRELLDAPFSPLYLRYSVEQEVNIFFSLKIIIHAQLSFRVSFTSTSWYDLNFHIPPHPTGVHIWSSMTF